MDKKRIDKGWILSIRMTDGSTEQFTPEEKYEFFLVQGGGGVLAVERYGMIEGPLPLDYKGRILVGILRIDMIPLASIRSLSIQKA